MKLMTYNILAGGRTRFPLILTIIRQAAPDFLAIQEANGFEKNDFQRLKEWSQALNLPYFELAPATRYDFHIASLSRYPFKKVEKIKLLQNACLLTEIESPLGRVTVVNAHPYPQEERERLKDIEKVLSAISNKLHPILLGDMNALSPLDGYPQTIVDQFNVYHLLKFTQNGTLVFTCIQKILAAHFTDVAVFLKQNQVPTAPNGIDLHEPFTITHNQPSIRLDYVFVRKELIKNLSVYKVIINDTTRKASDHFPVVVKLN